MKIEEKKDAKVWEDFVQDWHPNNFLASWKWGDFNEALGGKVFRLGLFDVKNLVGACLVVKVEAKRGSFLLCPSGPLIKNPDTSKFQFFLEKLKEMAREEAVNFIRLRPLYENGQVDEILDKLAPRRSPTHVHAQVSWILKIDKDEEQLLAEMRKTTRYLVRQADKMGVRVEEQNNEIGIKVLEKLQEETVKKHHFVPFSNDYLEKEFDTFGDQAKILIAKKGKEILSVAMIIFYGDSAFYHHGASISTKIPASYLLQWEAIKLAKSAGKKYYNFWGIAPTDSPNHHWAGLTLFKRGFGGFRLEYTQPRDIPLTAAYLLIYWFEKLRSYRRGLNV